MDADIEVVVTPVTIKIENDELAKIELGSVSREALRIEQIAALRGALDGIVEIASEPLDELNRSQHEDLYRWLAAAQRASAAIFWLIPADCYTEDDDQA
jgi:methyl coenzyme M reductase subunit C-like uncharacterized protein (methanogenesis marker protein 7)